MRHSMSAKTADTNGSQVKGDGSMKSTWKYEYSKLKHGCPVIMIEICNRQLMALVDTGASQSSINPELAKLFKLTPTGETVVMHTTELIECIELYCDIKIFEELTLRDCKIVATSKNYPFILGMDILKDFNINIQHIAQSMLVTLEYIGDA